MRIEIPEYNNKHDLFDFLMENKALHIMEKKADGLKKCDAVHCVIKGSETSKAEKVDMSTGKIEVHSAINTTNIMDSHQDVHVKGIWNKSLKMDNHPLLLQEHEMKFAKVISDNVIASVLNTSWKDLGFKFSGETQALMFKSMIEEARNKFMFDQYGKGFVKNHSVGMRYINLSIAINNDSSEFKEELDTYNKYINDIVNRKEVEDQGFFWAVKEARVIEGSAVVKGSNALTPTTSMQAKAAQSKDTPTPEQLANTQASKNYYFI